MSSKKERIARFTLTQLLILATLTLAGCTLVILGSVILFYPQNNTSSAPLQSDTYVSINACKYADTAANYLAETGQALEGAKTHIGSATLLQDDIDRLAKLQREFENKSAPVEAEQVKVTTASAISAAAGLLEEFQARRSGEDAASYYLSNLKAAAEEIKRTRTYYRCS